MRRILAVLILAVFGGACATTGGAGGSSAAGDRDLLTTEQIEAAALPNAYELVNRLRRAWLRGDPVTGGPVSVYMEDRELGGAEALREIPAVTVAELRLVSNEAAVMRWSPSIAGSVIVVVPRR